MSDDDGLRLNTLHRFRKHSPRLLLEEYSHCEVPAGCGGVVMRWVDPDAGIPALVRVHAPGTASTWIDGRQLASARVDLVAGSHVLALELEHDGELAEAPALLVSIVRALGRDSHDGDDVTVLLCSTPGLPWRITELEPGSEWTAPDYDDREWAAPTLAELDEGTREAWRVRQLRGHGAQPLALAGRRAWLRVRFEVAPLRSDAGGLG